MSDRRIVPPLRFGALIASASSNVVLRVFSVHYDSNCSGSGSGGIIETKGYFFFFYVYSTNDCGVFVAGVLAIACNGSKSLSSLSAAISVRVVFVGARERLA